MRSEAAVIGSMLMEPDCIDLVRQYIRSADYFDTPGLGKAYTTMVKLYENGEDIDLITVVDNLPESTNLQGFLESITKEFVTATHVEEYSKIVADQYARKRIRQLIKINPIDTGKYQTPLDVLTYLETGMREIEDILHSSEDVSAEDLVHEVIGDIEEGCGGSNNNLTPTGFIELDRLILGWERTENVILAARPGMGKTAMALNCGLNVAKSGQPVIFFSLEMGKKRLMERLLCIEGRIDSEKVKTRNLSEIDFQLLSRAAATIAGLDIWIYDDVFNMSEIRSIASRHAARGNIGMIVVDYIQLIKESQRFQNRNTELGHYAYEIARMAKSCRTTTLTLSQLSRGVESRENKRPVLSDLYESGAIEAAADKVLFIYRDEEYDDDTEDRGIAEVGCAKCRDGETGRVKLLWRGEYFRFDNLARESL